MTPRSTRILLAALLALEIGLLIFGPQTGDHLPAIQDAVAKGGKPGWWDDAAMGVRYAAWVNAGLLGVLLLTAKGWSRAMAGAEAGSQKPEVRKPRWFWPALISAAVVCLGLRLPLASKSLWWDEAWVIMQASHGKWTPDKKHPGELKFTAHDWMRCAWYYQKPTNHAPMSLLQKASIGAWQKMTGAKRSEFSELSARVPALIASCMAVLLLGLLLRAWGKPGAGVCGAFVLAVHPWAVRYGVDSRAYSLVMPLCISGMFAVTRIVECRGRRVWPWGWWGATEFLWMWAFPNAVFDVFALNIVAAVLLWKSHSEKRDRWSAMWRLAATNAFAAACFIQVFLPNLMQARRWAGKETDAHVLSWSMAGDTLSQVLFGVSELHASMRGWVGLGIAIFACLGVGLFRQRKQFGVAAPVLFGLSASSLGFALVTLATGSYFYPRFVVAWLPVVVAGVCLFLARLRAPLASAACVVLFGALSFGSLKRVLTLPISPLHDAAAFVAEQKDSRPIIACYGLGREVMPVYSPTCVPLEKREDVEAVLQRAKLEKRPLDVLCGYDSFNRSMLPTGFPLLDDGALFEEVKRFPALEPEFSFRVLRMK